MTMFLVVLSAVLACSVDRFSSHSFSLDTQNPFSYNSQTPSQFLGGELFKHAKSEVQRGMDPFTRSFLSPIVALFMCPNRRRPSADAPPVAQRARRHGICSILNPLLLLFGVSV
jgi:hypothetical protein